MITVILVFFLAIFGGMLFLSALIWFVFRRVRKPSPPNRHFSSSSSSNYGNDYVSSETDDDYTDSFDTSAAGYSDSSTSESRSGESSASQGTAHDSSQSSENVHSHTSHSEYSAPPADTSYSDSSSSYDSGSSYDSSSSYDSGSSSSDSGSSSSSSD